MSTAHRARAARGSPVGTPKAVDLAQNAEEQLA
jgi:hypothetical protein